MPNACESKKSRKKTDGYILPLYGQLGNASNQQARMFLHIVSALFWPWLFFLEFAVALCFAPSFERFTTRVRPLPTPPHPQH